MGRKALVDYSLIKEICENLIVSRKKFKGQLDLNPEDESTKTGKKTEEIKRLLVSRSKKETGSPTRKRRRKSPRRKKSPARFQQNATNSGALSDSTDPSSDLESESESESNFDEENLSDINSDANSDADGET